MALAVCVAVARVHWGGWLLFGAVGLWASIIGVLWFLVARDQSRFEERLRRDPSQLAYAYIETEPSRGMRCACELQLWDSAVSTFYIPFDMAKRLPIRASGWR